MCRFIRGRFAEVLDGDVPRVRIQHDRVGHRGYVDLRPYHTIADRRRDTGARERDLDRRTDRARRACGDPVRRPARRGIAVDGDDAIADLHARERGGETREDRGDAYLIAGLLDPHAQAAVAVADGVPEERRQLGGRIQVSVGVVELFDHSAGGVLVEHILRERIDRVGGHLVEHRIEQLDAGSVQCGRGASGGAGDHREDGGGAPDDPSAPWAAVGRCARLSG